MQLLVQDSLKEQTLGMEDENEIFELKKKIGLGTGIAIVAGTIVGSGIFVSPVGILEYSNESVGLSLVIWLACGVVSMLCALCYAELGTTITKSGADYAYLDRAYGGPVAFMYLWANLLIQRGTGSAGTAIIFGIYLVSPFFSGDCEPPTTAVKCAASALLLVCTAINYRSVKLAGKIQIVFTIAKFLGMFIIIVGGVVRLGQKDPIAMNNFNNAFNPEELSSVTVSMIGLAFYQGLWAYEGYNTINYVVEEIKDLPKNLPRSIVFGLLSVICFYFFVNVSYFAVLTPNEMISSKAVAVTFGHRVLGNFAWLMPLTVCLSIMGSLNGGMLTSSRLAYVASRNGHWPEFFGMIHSEYYTPVPSLLWDCGIALVFVIPGDFDSLISAFSFTTWTFRGLSCAGLIYLRWKKPDMERPVKIFIGIPILAVLLSIFFVIAPLIQEPELFYLYAFVFILASMLVYFPIIHKKMVLPRTDVATTALQQLIDVAPAEDKIKLI